MGVEEASVLITGVAGFIGAHTAIRLREIGHKVVGIDNMNNYYDVRLKLFRRRLIERAGATFIQGDVCNGTLIRRILRQFSVTHIVHLAAQAGVRYSKINPVTYGEANVMCTIRLLEQAKMVKPVPPVILYASSSSVYGRNVSIPFKETAVTNKPISIYAATKLATEHVAHAYHSLYNMRITGLRFFTVYGPMGRPDMAAWMWAKNISNGDALTLYEVSGAAAGGRGGELLRDFTFIDDIVTGVVLAIEYSADYAIFNLGRGQPQNVSLLIRMLEAELGKKALILRNPLPAGDVAVTFADTSLARKCLGYEPKVSIKEGVRSFVKWFKQYSPPKLPRNLTYINIDPDSHPGSLGIVA